MRALRGAERVGPKERLSKQQLRQIDRQLRKGPRAHGFSTDLWTLPRITVLIERLTGVKYHPAHVWKVLRALGWSVQRPVTRAKERNEAAVQDWKKVQWEAVKKKPGKQAPG